jgi:transcriptional regulator of acetoin/glycerol metabolism
MQRASTVLRAAAVKAAGESLITNAHLSDDFIAAAGGNISAAAGRLGISRHTVCRKLRDPGKSG